MKGLVSKGTVVPCHLGSETQNFAIKLVDKGQITNVKGSFTPFVRVKRGIVGYVFSMKRAEELCNW